MDAEYLHSTSEEAPIGADKKHGGRRIHPFSVTAAAPRPISQSSYCCTTFLVILSYLIFSSIIVAALILIMFVATTLLFVPQPVPPYFTVSSSSAEVFNVTGNLTRSNVFVSFVVDGSHNKGIVYYEKINVSISKNKERISSTTIEPFEQHRHNRTTQIAAVFEEMSVEARAWISGGAAEGECGVDYLDCELTVKERYKQGIKLWPAMEDNQRVECNGIKDPMPFSSLFLS
ncbi:hypothetical protein L6164_022157 [Bauhinia variegata]|uniref:Uncharacterized protein n=1 Tax=Bauhinia variegata TaxID=167791 RepID=A0ACB9MEC2_BAUVA|nr:hypothetical protein L6164_022157 [Bauhinia variegata]